MLSLDTRSIIGGPARDRASTESATVMPHKKLRQFDHILHLEEICDRHGQRGAFASQFTLLRKLCLRALGDGNRHRRLMGYYRTLDILRLQMRDLGIQGDLEAESLELRVVELLLQLDEALRPQPQSRPAPRCDVAEVVVEQPHEELVPLAARPASELSDEELAAMIPEDER